MANFCVCNLLSYYQSLTSLAKPAGDLLYALSWNPSYQIGEKISMCSKQMRLL